MKIETDRLVLRTPTLVDSPRIEELAGDYEIAKTTLNIPHPYPEGSAKIFIERMIQAEADGKIIICAIEEKQSGSVIGMINISVNQDYQRGELAYFIGAPFWNKGYGTEAARAIIDYGFKEFKLNKIFAASFTENPGSWKIMEKIGMKHEGVLRQHVIKWGKPVDLTYYSILREEYLSPNL